MPAYTDLINTIYSAADRTVTWDEVLVKFADYCGMANAALVFVAPHLHLAEVATPRADPQVVADYAAHWWAHDPTISGAMAARVGQITSLAEAGHDVFERSAFHNDYWRYSGLGKERLASNLLMSDGAFASIVLQAGPERDEIANASSRQFANVLPHLMRSVRLQKRMAELELFQFVSEVKQRTKGHLAILVDAAGRQVIDLPGVMSLPDGVLIHQGRLRLQSNQFDTALQDLIYGCAGQTNRLRGGRMVIPGSRGDTLAGVEIEVLPCGDTLLHPTVGLPRPVAIVVITDRTARTEKLFERLREDYGMTPAEARLAIEITSGDGRTAAADRLGISLSTARTHLSRVFEKTGTQRQAELVKTIASLLAKE